MKIHCSFIKNRLFGARVYQGAIKVYKNGRLLSEKISHTPRLTKTLALQDALNLKTKTLAFQNIKDLL